MEGRGARERHKGTPHLSVVGRKGPQVGDNPRGDEDVPCQVDVQLPELQGRVAPASFLAAQASNQLLGSLQLFAAQINLKKEKGSFYQHGQIK